MLHVVMFEPPLNVKVHGAIRVVYKVEFGVCSSGACARISETQLACLGAEASCVFDSVDPEPRWGAEGWTSLNMIVVWLLRSSDYVLLGQSDKTSCVLRMTVGMPLDRCARRVVELG